MQFLTQLGGFREELKDSLWRSVSKFFIPEWNKKLLQGRCVFKSQKHDFIIARRGKRKVLVTGIKTKGKDSQKGSRQRLHEWWHTFLHTKQRQKTLNKKSFEDVFSILLWAKTKWSDATFKLVFFHWSCEILFCPLTLRFKQVLHCF